MSTDEVVTTEDAATKKKVVKVITPVGDYTSTGQQWRSIERGIGGLVEYMPEDAALVVNMRNISSITDGTRTPRLLGRFSVQAKEKGGQLQVVVVRDSQVHKALVAESTLFPLNILFKAPAQTAGASDWVRSMKEGRKKVDVPEPKAKTKQAPSIRSSYPILRSAYGEDQWSRRW